MPPDPNFMRSPRTRRASIKIRIEQEAFDVLHSIINREIDFDHNKIDFSSAKWAKFRLKLTSRNYKSTTDSDLMRALIEYQSTIHRVAASVKDGKPSSAALDEDLKESVRINFKVVGGSPRGCYGSQAANI